MVSNTRIFIDSAIKSDIEYEEDFDDFDSSDKASKEKKPSIKEVSVKAGIIDDFPQKQETTTPPKNLFSKPKPRIVDPESLRSSAQDSVAKTIKGNKTSKAPASNFNRNSPFTDKKKEDFFDSRAKPVPAYKAPMKFNMEEDDHESDDYDLDFDQDDGNDIEDVTNNILNNIKSPVEKPKVRESMERKIEENKPHKINFNPPMTEEKPKFKSTKKSPVNEEKQGKATFITQKPHPKPIRKPSRKSQEPIRPHKKPAVPINPSKPQKPSEVRQSHATSIAADPIALEHLNNENDKLLKQINELTRQIDVRMISVRRRANQSNLSMAGTTKSERLKTK